MVQPRTDDSISSRSAMMKKLGIESVVKKAKKSDPEQKDSFLELIVEQHVTKREKSKKDEIPSVKLEDEKLANVEREINMMVLERTEPKMQRRPSSGLARSLDSTAVRKRKEDTPKAKEAIEELLIEEDIEESDWGTDVGDAFFKSNSRVISSTTDGASGKRLPSSVSSKVAKLILGEQKQFMRSWLRQGFHFNKHKGLEYGLVQNEGGTCGVVAVVQAIILQYLLHQGQHVLIDEQEKRKALIFALSTIIWNIGGKESQVVSGTISANRSIDTIFEGLNTYSLDSFQAVQQYFTSNIDTVR
jgi:hypothetical protein